MADIIQPSSTTIYLKPIAARSLLSRLKDPFSGLSHLLAALLSLGAGIWLSLSAALAGQPLRALSFAVFAAGLVLLYSASAVYHLLSLSPARTRWLRRIDHMMIYVLIASTYTPFCLLVLPGMWGTGILAAVWGLALAGILLSLFYLDAPRWLTVAIYIFMGWFCLAAIRPLVEGLSPQAMTWLAAGGVTYTVGAVIYALKRPRLFPGVFGFHEIWHVFVMGGSFCHFMAVLGI